VVSGGLRRLSAGEQHHKKTHANHDEDDRNNNQEKPSTVWALIAERSGPHPSICFGSPFCSLSNLLITERTRYSAFARVP
jgi:hypothetical protein